MGWLIRLCRKRKIEAQLDSELRFHIEQKAADLVAQGIDPAEARRQAMAKFGGVEGVKEECREVLGTRIIEALVQDIRFGARVLRSRAGFTAVAVLALALGIGLPTVLYASISSLLFPRLPYPHPGQLVILRNAPGMLTSKGSPSSPLLNWAPQEWRWALPELFR